MSFDVELEKDVLATCLRDVGFVRSANPVLRRHDFSSKALSWIWKVISETYSEARDPVRLDLRDTTRPGLQQGRRERVRGGGSSESVEETSERSSIGSFRDPKVRPSRGSS